MAFKFKNTKNQNSNKFIIINEKRGLSVLGESLCILFMYLYRETIEHNILLFGVSFGRSSHAVWVINRISQVYSYGICMSLTTNNAKCNYTYIRHTQSVLHLFHTCRRRVLYGGVSYEHYVKNEFHYTAASADICIWNESFSNKTLVITR